MPTPFILRAPFFEDTFYHIIFKSIDGILIFPEDDDYWVFKERIRIYICPVAEVWGYCFLKNHVHLVVRIKQIDAIIQYLATLNHKELHKTDKNFVTHAKEELALQKYILRRINSLLTSYSMSINKRYKRRGGLFQKPFKRVEIFNDDYLRRALVYVHTNPAKHKIGEFETYKYSSYYAMSKEIESIAECHQVLEFFGGLDSFLEAHARKANLFLEYDL